MHDPNAPIAPLTGPPLLYDSHVHTWYCQHAVGTLDEYVTAAFGSNFRGLIFTCHSPLPEPWAPNVRMAMAELPDYVAEVARSRRNWWALVDVRMGLECDFVLGFEKHVATLLDSADFDYVLGSVHPQFNEYQARYFQGDPVAFQVQYFDHVAQAAESGMFDALAHFDVVKEVFPETWDLKVVNEAVCRCLDRVAATGVAVELNTASANREVAEFSPSLELLFELRKRQIPVVLGSDAHIPRRVGDLFATALDVMRAFGFTHVHHFLGRQRQAVPLEEALASLMPATPAGQSRAQ